MELKTYVSSLEVMSFLDREGLTFEKGGTPFFSLSSRLLWALDDDDVHNTPSLCRTK